MLRARADGAVRLQSIRSHSSEAGHVSVVADIARSRQKWAWLEVQSITRHDAGAHSGTLRPSRAAAPLVFGAQGRQSQRPPRSLR